MSILIRGRKDVYADVQISPENQLNGRCSSCFTVTGQRFRIMEGDFAISGQERCGSDLQ